MQYASLKEWSDALEVAHRESNHPFWSSDHMNLRDMPRHSVNEALMVEKMWMWLGPQEHRWFSTFLPNVCELYPVETSCVHPWNAATAAEHYGRKPTMHYHVLAEREIGNLLNCTLEEHLCIGQEWKALRQREGMATNAWQLVHEMVQSLHMHDHLPFIQRAQYPSSVRETQLQFLEGLVPDNDWVLALACAGIPTDRLLHRLTSNTVLQESDTRALAWLRWWQEKSPDCMDGLAYSWINNVPADLGNTTKDTATSIVQHLNMDAKDARDVFGLARQMYGDLKEESPFVINSSDLSDVFVHH